MRGIRAFFPNGCVRSPVSHSAETPVSLLIIMNCAPQVIFRKIRPENIIEPQLAVGALPHKEVAEPILSARSDDKVRVMLTARVKVFFNRFFRRIAKP